MTETERVNEDWYERRMTDEELLDRTLETLGEVYWTLVRIHGRHRPWGEDICCRVVTGDAIQLLAEGERREEAGKVEPDEVQRLRSNAHYNAKWLGRYIDAVHEAMEKLELGNPDSALDVLEEISKAHE